MPPAVSALLSRGRSADSHPFAANLQAGPGNAKKLCTAPPVSLLGSAGGELRNLAEGSAKDDSVATAGEIFHDHVIELVRREAGGPALLAWDGNSAKVAAQLEYGQKIYVPLALEPTILRALRLPKQATAHGSTAGLFSSMV